MISFKRYINITSGVGGGAAVAARELIARIFTTNELLPTGTIHEFESADDVADYFGSDSEEYSRSAQYFGWIGKSIEAAQKIAFARWADADTAPQIFGVPADYLLTAFTSISNGAISLRLGATTHVLTGMDFTGDLSLADVAATIQAKINAETGTMWTAAAVDYDAVRKSFNLTGGDVGNAVIAVAAPGSGTDIRSLVGWTTSATYSDGMAVQAITDLLADSTELSNNFGSFCFIPELDNDQVVEAATWNDTQNVMFQYHVPVLAANAATLKALVVGYSGIGLTLDPEVEGEYPEMFPMTILAATHYNRRNIVKNYMFQMDTTLTPSVETNADANTYDALRVNYIGITQQAGAGLSFYQRGYLMGGTTDPVDMGVYANEQWFKDACGVAIMELLLSLDQVPASSAGEGQILAQLQSIIDLALFNGTIEPGKTLTSTQKQYIAQITGDPNAWHQIVSLGYWIEAHVESYVANEVTQYKIVYTLVYAKGDSIRKVEGTDILI